ncbi:lysophospholipid acyltransferase family protein [Novosphingobium sp. JCM 18896]|uniref:lysophospholipid acyltransferase family protein n=1 Tax=Novosphingobium sp. JCM 18896 TaxID=2989731 RepID=UPI002222D4E5|nr:lysophospholipid acyltransferase family protein [Novosphingobium sp. JCM 18896]MCW1430744.1 1-acyl-sn-glycerol-3-phosphate acyltransferase [Novosphingobium sp. JCM 18896]
MIGALLRAATRFLVGGHARWQGCAPSSAQRIYFANHSSHLDTLILWAALPEDLRPTTHPVAAQDYWGKGRLRRHIATKVLNAVLVDRSTRHDPLAPLRAALDRGHSLILFPEGTRSSATEPGRFKGGLHHLARDYPAVELVPVHLTNLARAYPKGAILPAPIVCTASFGAPIALAADETKPAFLERARQAVRTLGDVQ